MIMTITPIITIMIIVMMMRIMVMIIIIMIMIMMTSSIETSILVWPLHGSSIAIIMTNI